MDERNECSWFGLMLFVLLVVPVGRWSLVTERILYIICVSPVSSSSTLKIRTIEQRLST